MNIYNELKVFSMIVGLHTLVISLCAIVLQFVFIAYVFFLTGTWDVNFMRALLFIKAGAFGGFIAGFGVWLMYYFIPKFR